MSLTTPALNSIRHTCEQGDELEAYAWLEHDGRNYGSQTIKDGKSNVEIKTDFVKVPGGQYGGEWAVRISGTPIDASKDTAIALYFYTALTGEGSLELLDAKSAKRGLNQVQLNGNVPSLGDFSFVIHDDPNNSEPESTKKEYRKFADLSKTQYAAFNTPPGSTWKVKDILQERLLKDAQALVNQHRVNMPQPPHTFALQNKGEAEGTIFVFQKMLKAPFQFDVAFVSKSAHPEKESLVKKDASHLIGDELTEKLALQKTTFHDRFEKTFKLKAKGFTPEQVRFGEMMLSNMLGGIGYFHGTNIVDRSLEGWEESEPVDFLSGDSSSSDEDDYFGGDDDEVRVKKPAPNPQIEGPSSLFSAVPSRPFFPRGFLWDEGFHQLLIGAWDNDLSLDVISSWSSKIDENGWVAREQILGDESASKVPAEFQIQYSHFANPPTLLMSLLKFIERSKAENFDIKNTNSQKVLSTEDTSVLTRMHLDNPDLAKEYLRKVYPKFRKQYFWFRKTQWGDNEGYGRDGKSPEAYRWRGRSDFHTLTSGLDDYPRANPPDASEIHVDLLSWVGSMAKALRAIAKEIGEEADIKKFDKHLKNVQIGLDAFHWNERAKAYCDAVSDGVGQSSHVVHLGYLNLFPYVLGIIPGDSKRIENFLDLISDPNKLWTDFGLSSLSKSDKYFGTGENYWRGPIWMNIQYLVVRRLYELKNSKSPYAARAGEIYVSLRENIINNVYKEYERTGFVWEQYSPIDGKGQRSHPFTGWTSLVLLMMAEVY
ncbi:glycoside hydrolase [Rhizoclosmatium globosum]|uniref:Mannosyl-oligosaccharide glucosidase n=1 Tax=Rhizoclosmatium globosum TaxID=329046 RepID=A0A1Y2CNR1_9FUNG|nr:glycoside hydrolase [Rhizoclosmatium globosum]|eukprot:ORY48586.1 glycoside hydrolase [Rhizoclosmatium globosum]